MLSAPNRILDRGFKVVLGLFSLLELERQWRVFCGMYCLGRERVGKEEEGLRT